MKISKQNCGNCAHSSGWSLTPTGRFARSTSGKCSAPVVMTSQPVSVVRITEERYWMRPTDGADCKAWSEKP